MSVQISICPHSSTKREKKTAKSSAGKNAPKGKTSREFINYLTKSKAEGSHEEPKTAVLLYKKWPPEIVLSHGIYIYEVNSTYNVTSTSPDKKPTNCKHVIWVYLFVLSIDEEDEVLPLQNLSRDEILRVLHSYAMVSHQELSSQMPATYQVPHSQMRATHHCRPLTRYLHKLNRDWHQVPTVETLF